MDGSPIEEKYNFNYLLRLSFICELDVEIWIVSFTKFTSWNLNLFYEVIFLWKLYVNKSTIWTYEEYCHMWVIASNCNLDKLVKELSRAVALKSTACFKHLTHWLNVASWSISYKQDFCIFLSGLAELVPHPCFYVRSRLYCDKLHDFSVTVTTFYENVAF